MRTLQTLALIVLFCYGGFMCGYFLGTEKKSPTPAVEVKAEPKPITDWNKFYDAVKNNKVRLAVGVAPLTPRASHYDLYLVEGDDWIKIGWSGMRGCGREMDEYWSYFSLDKLEREMIKVPSASAKFVAVGPGGVVVKGFRVEYFEDD
jgi:hypothetical protein